MFYPVFARSSRELSANFATSCCALANASNSVVVGDSYKIHLNLTKFSHLVHGDGRNLRFNHPHFHRVCTRHHAAW